MGDEMERVCKYKNVLILRNSGTAVTFNLEYIYDINPDVITLPQL
jgi:hypothetical protein